MAFISLILSNSYLLSDQLFTLFILLEDLETVTTTDLVKCNWSFFGIVIKKIYIYSYTVDP